MLNYIKSEIYRNLCKRGTYIFIGALALLSIAVNIYMAIINSSDNPSIPISAGESFGIAILSMNVPLILTFFIASMFFSEDHRNMAIKNSIGFGIGRMQIFFGKFIVELIYCLIICAIIFGVYIGSAYLIVGAGDAANTASILNQLLQSILYSLPLWIGGLAVSNALCFIFKHTRVQVGTFFGIFVVIPFILEKMASYTPQIAKTLNYMPSIQLTLIPKADSFTPYLIVGIFYMLIAFVVGTLFFRKAEVK